MIILPLYLIDHKADWCPVPPEDLLNELKTLKEPVSYHLEKAVRLYFKVIKGE